MESRAEMLDRHARELAELDSRWWEEWFTEDPYFDWLNSDGFNHEKWMKEKLPAIIRKRDKIGVTVCASDNGKHYLMFSKGKSDVYVIDPRVSAMLAGRTLAPGEQVEI